MITLFLSFLSTATIFLLECDHHPPPPIPPSFLGTATIFLPECDHPPRPRGRRRRQNLAQNPPLRRTGPQGTRNAPDNLWSAAGGFTQAPGARLGSKLTRTRRISRGQSIMALCRPFEGCGHEGHCCLPPVWPTMPVSWSRPKFPVLLQVAYMLLHQQQDIATTRCRLEAM